MMHLDRKLYKIHVKIEKCSKKLFGLLAGLEELCGSLIYLIDDLLNNDKSVSKSKSLNC